MTLLEVKPSIFENNEITKVSTSKSELIDDLIEPGNITIHY